MKPHTGAGQAANVRGLAAELYRACLSRGLSVEEAIAAHNVVGNLDPRDRALLVSIILTGFRHRGEIEAVLARLMQKPLPRKSGSAGDILRLGIGQLLFAGMAAHAVIDLSVSAAKADREARHFAGLVNAVLRRAATGSGELRKGLDTARLNTPEWLWARWCRVYGEEGCRKIAEMHAERPPLDLSFKSGGGGWAERLGGLLLPNGQVRLPADHAPVNTLPGYDDGAWWVQNAAAAIPARLAGDVKGKRVLDLCAAPGGKTLQLAAAGADVTAVDVSAARANRLRENLARTGLAAGILVADALSGEVSGLWDVVLLDAPCSATGTIRRHPELPHVKQEAQIAGLAGIQRRLLARAAELVRPDGVLVYSVCSLEAEEGEDQIRAFLARGEPFETIRAAGAWLPEGCVDAEGWVRCLPFMTLGGSAGMDGFFAAALRRLG